MKKLLQLFSIAAIGFFFSVTPALAVLPNNPDITWGANGKVRVIHRVGNIIYIGGDFTQLVNNTGQTMTRNRLAAIDATTGAPTSWNPNVNNSVYTIETSSAGNTVFFGGSFTTVGGQTRNRIAAVNASDGAVTAFNPNANNVVRAIERFGSNLYVGGNFTTMSGQTRTRLARMSTGGSLNSGWIPTADVVVSSIAIPADGARILIAGSFNTINGTNEPRIASLNPTTGALNAWASNPTNVVLDLAVSATTLYAAEAGNNRLSAFNLTNGNLNWAHTADGDLQTVEFDSATNRLFAGGHFMVINGQNVRRLVQMSPTGVINTAWTPTPNSGSGTEVLGVWSLAISGNKVYAGGDFTTVNGVNQPKFAQFTDQ